MVAAAKAPNPHSHFVPACWYLIDEVYFNNKYTEKQSKNQVQRNKYNL
jgi:hypothetical protein